MEWSSTKTLLTLLPVYILWVNKKIQVKSSHLLKVLLTTVRCKEPNMVAKQVSKLDTYTDYGLGKLFKIVS